jgi:asparagine synthase (glutamine-hydrolysing)
MCGIAGVATADGLAPTDPQLVDRMLGQLAHRGPDDQHAVADSNAAIGARRLSIIDLDTGRQPVSNEDGTVHVAQNGEIYNYVELRKSLEARGHRFSTAGDTETIVHLYEEYEENFVDHLRGMFAAALWDSRRRRLVLARDRLGKKPLYWRLRGGRLTFGSELKALLCDATVDRRLDRVALAQYLQYQYVPAPRTILADVAKLPPATVLTWCGDEPTLRRYWEPRYDDGSSRTLDEDREAFGVELREAVRLRLRSDVPVGVFLSGGMDSSTIVAVMAELGVAPIRTFTIGFDDPRYDELPQARALAQAFNAEHVEEVVSVDSVSLLPALTDHFDEPFGDSSAIPTFRVSQLAARDVKVVLTGDGGDELLGGYDRYRLHRRLSRLDHVPPSAVRAGLGAASAVAGRMGRAHSARRLTMAKALIGVSADQRYARLMSIFDESTRRDLLNGENLADQDDYLVRVLAAGPPSTMNRLLRADTLTYLPEDLLVKMDRATMANSLEARAPLLDHRLVELVAAMPESRKVQGTTSKALLRDAAARLLPRQVLERPKKGFGVPLGSWFRDELGHQFREVVLTPDARIRDHMDQSVAGALFREHQGGREHGHRLWVLLMFELWARRWGSGAVRAA